MREPTLEDFDRVDRKVLEDIETYGWSDISVFPTAEKPGLPFNYSVGLTQLHHPELLVMGLDRIQMHGILSAVYDQIKAGTRFEPGIYSDQVIENFDVALVEVLDLHHEDYMMSMATRFYGNRATGLQIVWPDQNGRFPWHDDFNQDIKGRQILTGPWMPPQ